MSESTWALITTVAVLVALAAWVPLLHAVQTLTLRRSRTIEPAEASPATLQDVEGLDGNREVA